MERDGWHVSRSQGFNQALWPFNPCRRPPVPVGSEGLIF